MLQIVEIKYYNMLTGSKPRLLDEWQIAYTLCKGGWPESVKIKGNNALKIPANYIDLLCESDISRVDGVKRNLDLARAILTSYARQISTIDSNKALFKDIQANFSEVTERTIIDYVSVLKKLYAIDEAEEQLITLKNLIMKSEPRLGAPKFLMIVTGMDMAYTTKNGVLVVPVGCLKH